MTKDDMDIVSALQNAIADRVGKERYAMWFGPRSTLQWDGTGLTITAPNQFFLEFIRSNFRTLIESACMQVLGRQPSLEYQVVAADVSANDVTVHGMNGNTDAPVESTRTPLAGASTPSNPASTGSFANNTAAANTAAPSTATPTTISPRKFASLTSFVVGASNRLAHVSAEMVARNPGKITPLVVHGRTGVGKTHLLEGIWSAERRAGRGASTVYLSAEQFTSQFLEALRGTGLPNFRRKYRGVQVLIVDDLHFLAGKRATQVELLHTIDTLLREGKQLVFASDRAPAELGDFMPELATRLSGGMVCGIDPPDYPTRLGIVSYLARRFKMELPAEVERFVAARLTAHAREISGALCRLQAMSEAAQTTITLELAEEALGDMIQQNNRVVRLGDIEKAVCKTFGLDPQSLQTDAKSRRISHPRMLAMWLARKHTRAALSEIGKFFGNRSHSTVISAHKRVEGWVTHEEPLQLADQTVTIDEAIRQVERNLTAG